MQLTPATSWEAGPNEYCFWNGDERFAPRYLVPGTEHMPKPGHVFDNVEDFARRIYDDYGWYTSQTTGEPMGELLIQPDFAHRGKNCVIGAPGFNWLYLDEEGRYQERFPHIGGVLFGTKVTIDDYVTIDRAGVGNTYIDDHTHIDSHVHVGHNARIGRHVQITAGAIIGGGAIIGNNVFIGLGAIIRNKVSVGHGATIGMGAVVVKDVPAGETWVGNPARPLA